MPEHLLYLRGYTFYRYDTDHGLRVHGGAVIFVQDSVHLQEIALQSTLPVVSINIILSHLSFIAYSLYLNPSGTVSATDLFDLLSELSTL